MAIPLTDPAEYVYDDYHQSYHEQIERASTLPFVRTGGGTIVAPSPVRIAIVDSSPDSAPAEVEPTIGTYAHGRAMGLVMRETMCPQGRLSKASACPAQFKNYLALNLAVDEDGVNEENLSGGYFGHLSTLAIEINQAVDDWEALPTPRPRLLVNLSVGWEPAWTSRGHFSSAAPRRIDVGNAAGQAVRAAIQRAECKGALVIAAVGNGASGTISNVGPMLPAAWAQETSRCGGAPSFRPMLYAAGGVDGTDAELPLRRESARTALLAPSAFVVVNNGAVNPDPTPEYFYPATGSSFSAALLTSAAGIVWAYQPTLTQAQVISQVYANAEPLATPIDPMRADVCFGSPCASARRISICRTLNDSVLDACSVPGRICPTPVACHEIDAREGSNAQVDELPLDVDPPPPVAWETVDVPECDAGQVWTSVKVEPSEALCPDEHYDHVGATPYAVAGQPQIGGCGSCIIFDQYDIYWMTVHPQWDAATPILSASLTIDGGQPINFPGPFVPGGQYAFQLPPVANPAFAKIAFHVQGNANANMNDYSFTEQVNISY